MLKLTLVVRGGLPEKLKSDIEEIISDIGEQDNFFVTDIKTHSIDIILDHEQIGPLITRIQGRFNLSIIKNNYLGTDHSVFVSVMGKLQDSAVVKTMQSQVKGLF